MPKKPNYLLGFGERLTESIPPPKGGGDKAHPYTFDEARERLSPKIIRTVRELNSLPPSACPDDHAVALVTVHPTYLAKTYYPNNLFNSLGLRAIGSRQREVRPEKWATKKHPETAITAEFFVAGPRQHFRQWANILYEWEEDYWGADDLRKVEDLRAPEERVKPIYTDDPHPLLEVVLHASADSESAFILNGFKTYLKSLDIRLDLNRRIHAGGLCFLPLRVPQVIIPELAKFSFLRVARIMPSLRQFRPFFKNVPGHTKFACSLPKVGPLDPTIKVAIFDGGLPASPDLKRWSRELQPPDLSKGVAVYKEHGLAVTSALLFGPLEENRIPERPYASVDHYCVLDDNTGRDPQGELLDVLQRIRDILQTRQYDFINLSIGPDIPIEDDDVHMWTSVLDPFFATGKILPFIAVGNSGENDRVSGNARIQTPSDCVNGLSVGAADSLTHFWRRAGYSSIGPGRCPGLIKPDALAFGGSNHDPYWVLDSKEPGFSAPTMGTSFATPTALRTAIGIRAHLGPMVIPLTLKALLLHRCENRGHDACEVGWGRIPNSVEELITCDERTVHVIYQGELAPAQWLRAKIPVPTGPLAGRLEIGATMCFATYTDPQDPINYTRSGLDIIFRPNHSLRKKGRTNANTRPFFQGGRRYATEGERRRDAHKWETTLSAHKRFLGTSLSDPVFDIHYNARTGGRPTTDARSIPYALVVTVRAPQIPNLYDRILQRYRHRLEVLQPVIQIPIRT